MKDFIAVKGARRHNLRDVSVELPKDALIVVTGISGRGKSSLAFHAFFVEGQWRYVKSLSAYARQFLGSLDKPDVDVIEGLSPAVAIDQKSSRHNSIDVVVDRLTVKPDIHQRLTESMGTALDLAGGVLHVDFADLDAAHPGREAVFSEAMACPRSHPVGLEVLEPRLFSFSSPWGACPECTGLGAARTVGPELVVHDTEKSLADGAVAHWPNTSGADYFARLLEALAVGLDFDFTTPWRQLPAAVRKAQRIRLATRSGAGPAGVLYALDKPSIGLHQRDNRRPIETLRRLRDHGSTVIVVERDEDTMRAADWLIYMGPEGGHRGGTVIAQGTPEDVASQPDSCTGRFLRDILKVK